MSDLKELGFTEYEIKVYETLLAYGTLDAKEIAQNSTVPPTAVYPILQKLKEKVLIAEIQSDVRKFSALPPENALQNYAEQQILLTKQLTKNAILNAKKQINQKQIEPKKQLVSVSQGNVFSIKQYQELIPTAKKSCYIFGWRFKTPRNKFNALHTLKDAQNRGVDVRLILGSYPNKQTSILNEYLNAKIPIHNSEYENFSMLVIDGKLCKISIREPLKSERTNLEFAHESFAKSMHDFFLETWSKTKPYE